MNLNQNQNITKWGGGSKISILFPIGAVPAPPSYGPGYNSVTPELGGRAGGAAAPVALYQEGQGGQRCPLNLKDCLGEIGNCQKC